MSYQISGDVLLVWFAPLFTRGPLPAAGGNSSPLGGLAEMLFHEQVIKKKGRQVGKKKRRKGKIEAANDAIFVISRLVQNDGKATEQVPLLVTVLSGQLPLENISPLRISLAPFSLLIPSYQLLFH